MCRYHPSCSVHTPCTSSCAPRGLAVGSSAVWLASAICSTLRFILGGAGRPSLSLSPWQPCELVSSVQRSWSLHGPSGPPPSPAVPCPSPFGSSLWLCSGPWVTTSGGPNAQPTWEVRSAQPSLLPVVILVCFPHSIKFRTFTLDLARWLISWLFW